MSQRTALDVMALYGQAFAPAGHWQAWRTFLKALAALPMDEGEQTLYRACTGRAQLADAPAREAWMVVGRRGGKSRMAAFLAVYLAAFRRYRLAPGERGVVMVIAADRRQARVILRYVVALLEAHPMTADLITGRRRDGVELSGGIDVEIHTASYKTTRGYTVVACLLDEIAFWENAEDAAESDTDILNALRPAMATVPEALLLGLSSPYARRGELWKAYQRHFGQDGAVLVWQADTRTMNPSVPQTFIDAAYAEDEASAAAEYGAEFRRDIEAFLSREAVEGVTVAERREIPPMVNVSYVAFVDPSGGSQDSMTLAIAHRQEDTAVLDCVREVKAPFSPDAAVQAFATTLREYGIRSVSGDKYAGEWPRERFRRHGVEYRSCDQTKSELYQALAPIVNGGRCELLDAPVLQKQLLGLERKTTRSGKDSIDHGPRGRDDVANAVAGALVGTAVGLRAPCAFAYIDGF